MVVVSQAEFARLCDVNRSSVSRAIKRQRLAASAGKITLNPSDDTPEALQAAARAVWTNSASSDPHHQARLRQLEEERTAEKKRELQAAADNTPSADEETQADPSIEAINKRIKLADAKKRENDARTAEINRLALEGDYLQRESVEYGLRDHNAVIRRELENLADRLAPVVHPLETVEEVRAAIAKSAEDIQRTVNKSMSQAMKAAREIN